MGSLRRISLDDLPLEIGTLVAMAIVDAREQGAVNLHSKYQSLIDNLTANKDNMDFDKMYTAIGIALVEHVIIGLSGN